jgi:hypothetical protein
MAVQKHQRTLWLIISGGVALVLLVGVLLVVTNTVDPRMPGAGAPAPSPSETVLITPPATEASVSPSAAPQPRGKASEPTRADSKSAKPEPSTQGSEGDAGDAGDGGDL